MSVTSLTMLNEDCDNNEENKRRQAVQDIIIEKHKVIQ